MRKAILLFGLTFILSIGASAQKNQLAAVLGVKLTPDAGTPTSVNGVTKVNNTFAFEGNFAHQLVGVPLASVQLEFPLIFTRQATLKTLNLLSARSYSSFFITP